MQPRNIAGETSRGRIHRGRRRPDRDSVRLRPLLRLRTTAAIPAPRLPSARAWSPRAHLAPTSSTRPPRRARPHRDRRSLDRRRLPQRTAPVAPQGVLGGVRRVSPLSAWRRPPLRRLEDRRARRPLGRQAVRGGDQPPRDDRARRQPVHGLERRVRAPRLTKRAYAEQLVGRARAAAAPAARRGWPHPLRRRGPHEHSAARAHAPVAPHRRGARRARATGARRICAGGARPGRAARHAARHGDPHQRPARRRRRRAARAARPARGRPRRHGAPRDGSGRARLHARRRGACTPIRSPSSTCPPPPPTCAPPTAHTVDAGRSTSGGARSAPSARGYELVLTDQPFGIPLRRAFAARQRRA